MRGYDPNFLVSVNTHDFAGVIIAHRHLHLMMHTSWSFLLAKNNSNFDSRFADEVARKHEDDASGFERFLKLPLYSFTHRLAALEPTYRRDAHL
jgi:hypothetical protein